MSSDEAAIEGDAPRVCVRGRERAKWVTPVSALFLLAALACGALPAMPQWTSLIGLSALACLEGWAFFEHARRRFVTDLGDAFSVTDRHGTRTLRLTDIEAVARRTRPLRENGVAKGVVEACTVWPELVSVPIDLSDTVPAGRADPLARLRAAIVASVASRAKARLAAGGVISERAWTLDQSQLTISGVPPRRYALDDIVVVGRFGGALSIWLRNADLPVARIPLESRNAVVLERVLGERLRARGTRDESPAHGLGRLLFERKLHRVGNVAGVVGVLLCVLAGAVASIEALTHPLVMGSAIGGVCATLLALRLRQAYVRCHAGGVACWNAISSPRQLLHDEIAAMSYSATRQYYNGGYVGTTFAFELVPTAESRRRVLRCSGAIRNETDEEDLTSLRDHVSKPIFLRMHADFASGKEVEWTRMLAFSHEGIVVRGRKPRVVPWQAIQAWNVVDGTFYVFDANRRELARTSCADRNFHPGLMLFHALMSDGAG
jgi:hypothetical protein